MTQATSGDRTAGAGQDHMTNRSAGAGRDGSRLREALDDAFEAGHMAWPSPDLPTRAAMRTHVVDNIMARLLAVPDPLASDTGQGQISDREAAHENLIDMLLAVEWVRQSAGNKYACPFCHGITERDGGPGHADDCRWLKAVSAPLASSSAPQGENTE